MTTTDRRRNTGRSTGLALILSTPVTAFISFALFASLIDEDRLEGTLLGIAVMLLPATIGVATLIWAQCRLPLPNATAVALVVGLLGIALTTIGIGGIIRSAGSNDANIGAPFLTVGGLAAMAIAVGILVFDHFSKKRAAELPPPPSAPPTAPPPSASSS